MKGCAYYVSQVSQNKYHNSPKTCNDNTFFAKEQLALFWTINYPCTTEENFNRFTSEWLEYNWVTQENWANNLSFVEGSRLQCVCVCMAIVWDQNTYCKTFIC